MIWFRFLSTIFALTTMFRCKETSAPVSCPTGFSPHLDGMCYKVGTSLGTWTKSRLYCRQFNAEIVKISDSATNEHVNKLAKEAHVSRAGYWIGLNDIRREGEFCWLDDSPKVYHEFISGQPNGGIGQACVIRGDTLKGWHDADCFRELAVVCQYSPGGVYSQSEIRAVHSSLSLPDFLFGHVLSRLTSRSVLHCAALCLREMACDMYAYLEDKYPELNCVLMIMGYERNDGHYDFKTKVYRRLKEHHKNYSDKRDRPCHRLSLT